MKSWAVLAVSVFLGGALLGACAGSGSGSAGSGGEAGSVGNAGSASSAGSVGNAGSASSAGSTGSASSGGGGACSMLMTYDACDACECTKHQAGCDKYSDLEDQNCACNAGAPCEMACKGYCGGGMFDMACEACFTGLADNAPCYAATTTACQMDPVCKEYEDASDASCANLP